MATNLSDGAAQGNGWSKELLYQLVENVKDYAIFVADPDGRIVSWNAGAEKLFGYTAAEAINMNARELFTSEDRANQIPEKEMETAVSEGVAQDERWHLRKDGERLFMSGLQTPLYDSEHKLTGFAKIARDLTERIEAQEELLAALESVETKVHERTNELNLSNESLRSEVTERTKSDLLRAELLRKIVRTQEDERKRIAREIHDHIGQQMTALQLRLQLLVNQHQGEPVILSELDSLKALAAQIDSEVDFLAWELRPSVLDDLGLATAAKRFVDDWSAHFQMSAAFCDRELDGKRLTPEIEINLYRIIQEALNNVAKHAQANFTSVLLEYRDGTIHLIIEDDGVGFEPTEQAILTGNDRGMGLLGMKERAELIGGSAEIETSPGKGTTIFVRVPAQFEEAKHTTA